MPFSILFTLQAIPRPKISLTDAATGKRVRVNGCQPGDALVAALQPILVYC